MTNERPSRTYTLLGVDRQEYPSDSPGAVGGHRSQRLYGRLDCASARRAIDRGGYVRDRVFFADRATAIAAGYRPCHTCLRADYGVWKARGITGEFSDRTFSGAGELCEVPWVEGDLELLVGDSRKTIGDRTVRLLDYLGAREGGPYEHGEVEASLGLARGELRAAFSKLSWVVHREYERTNWPVHCGRGSGGTYWYVLAGRTRARWRRIRGL
ncbi:Ada metal-binding domain-containing protein [Streptomyces sp. NPDC087440]|uniref:Ada metal-binding domain-containing protein n=1 Tax=Streptomyces sp. NPDC087440 TaxID=3365790 RepID=UPI003825F921